MPISKTPSEEIHENVTKVLISGFSCRQGVSSPQTCTDVRGRSKTLQFSFAKDAT